MNRNLFLKFKIILKHNITSRYTAQCLVLYSVTYETLPISTLFYGKQMNLFSQEDSRGNCGMTKSQPLFVHTVAAR